MISRDGVSKRGLVPVIPFVISVILLLLYSFTISHVDCNTIVTWGYDLLESVRNGDLTNYPVYTYLTHGMPTNYSLFSNAVTAIWLLPIYVLDRLFGLGWDMVVYDVWYKVLILASVFIAVFVFDKALSELNYSKDNRRVAFLAFATSAVLLLSVVGKGQIDAISVMLVVIAIYMHITDRVSLAFLFIGLACLFKPFAILLGVPYLLLMIGRCGKKTILNTLYLIGPYVLNYILTIIIMPKYREMSDITSEAFKESYGSSRIEEIFNIRINSILIFIGIAIVLCFFALYIGSRNKTKKAHLLTIPVLLYMSYIVFANPSSVYWLMNIVPLIIIMGLNLRRTEDFLLLSIGINLGVCIFIPVAERAFIPAKNYSLLHNVREYTSPLERLSNVEYMKYIEYTGVTLYIVCIVLIIAVYLYEHRSNKSREANTITANKARINTLMCLSVIPQILYLAFVYIVC